MGTDFFDEDLAREREEALKIKLDGSSGGAPRDGVIPSSRDLPNRPVSNLSLTQFARHKQEVNEQMEDRAQELDRLRARQEELEEERRLLEELREKQEAFEQGRRELKEHLAASLSRMGKEQAQAERMVELLGETRRTFSERQAELAALKEEDWPDDSLLEELNKALEQLESIRSDFNKGTAKVEAVRSQAGDVSASLVMDSGDENPVLGLRKSGQGMSFWLRAGFAFMLPAMLWLTALLLIWMIFVWFGY